MTETMEIETPVGRARLRLHAAATPRALLLLGHGAGGGVASPDLIATTEVANELDISVGLVEQPYRVAGRRSPAPAGHLDTAWVAVVDAARASLGELPLLVGGRSSGARVACRTAEAARAAGIICLAFPLHPPGKPEKTRLPELEAVPASVPVLIVQGQRDPFGMPPAGDNRQVVPIPGTHTLGAKGPVHAAVGEWLFTWLAFATTGGLGA